MSGKRDSKVKPANSPGIDKHVKRKREEPQDIEELIFKRSNITPRSPELSGNLAEENPLPPISNDEIKDLLLEIQREARENKEVLLREIPEQRQEYTRIKEENKLLKETITKIERDSTKIQEEIRNLKELEEKRQQKEKKSNIIISESTSKNKRSMCELKEKGGNLQINNRHGHPAK